MKILKKIWRGLRAAILKIIRRHPKESLIFVGCIITVIMVIGVVKDFSQQKEVQAVTEEVLQQSDKDKSAEETKIPKGFEGIIEGVIAQAAKGNYHAIGTSLEDVLVGQRTTQREKATMSDVGSQVAESVNDIDNQSWELIERTKISDNDYETLLAIVEAEAGGEDIEGRILVANVIINRVASEYFPNTVTEVVWQKSGGSPQFTPTVDGRIQTVTVSDTTREAVNCAIDGKDHSEGALFFLEREYSEKQNIAWFDSSLKFLFKHGVHSFYKY